MISIIGVGALGSHVAMFVRNIPEEIQVIDFDRIERKNIASQFHSQNSIGKNKALALQQLCQFLFSLKIKAVPHKLTESNDQVILEKSKLLVDCLDNGNSRRVIQNFVRKNKIPCLHGALSDKGQFGRVIWDEDFVIDDESDGNLATCHNGDFLPFISLVASLISLSIQNFITNNQKIGFQVTPTGVITV